MKMFQITIMSLVTAYVSISAASLPPMVYKTIGNPDAPQGGTIQIHLTSEPESLNPISSQDGYSQDVQNLVMDGLMVMNVDTYEWEPGLAERYELSKDKMTYTFYLRKDAKFHDGKPVTAEDVKFSFDVVKNPAYKAAHRIPYYENFGEVEIVDPYTVRIPTKKKYFKNFDVMVSVGFTAIVPKHIYGDPSKKLNKELHGSGPYKMETYDKGKSITLVRNKDWWGKSVPHLKGKYNFDKILMRFVKEENLQLEMMKKGQLDYLEMTPEAFHKKTEEAPWGKTVLKKKIQNSDPTVGWGFVAWNLLNPMFQDKRVRTALAHLMDREEMIKKFRFGASYPATGAWEVTSPFHNKELKPLLFDLSKAKQLLKEAGWEDRDKNGILEKEINGKTQEFRFDLMFSNRDAEKYYTIYKEGLKKAGIEANLKLVEWNSFVKAMDEKKFEAISLAWGGGSVEGDPKQIWHSESARTGGSNFISYANPEVDKLIDQAREELDAKKRGEMWRKIDKLIAEDAPYAFLWNRKYGFYGLNGRIGQVKDTYKYDVGVTYFWMKN